MGIVIRLDIGKGDKIMNAHTTNKANIDRLASNLLKEHNMEDAPVDLIKLCTEMGIVVKEGTFTDDTVSGMLTCRDNKPTIIVNSKHAYVRKRFTIAHEIGHFALRHRDVTNGNFSTIFRDGASNAEEQEANRFAAALLVNRDDLKSQYETLSKLKITRDEIITVLANFYTVSRQTLIYRLQEIEA